VAAVLASQRYQRKEVLRFAQPQHALIFSLLIVALGIVLAAPLAAKVVASWSLVPERGVLAAGQYVAADDVLREAANGMLFVDDLAPDGVAVNAFDRLAENDVLFVPASHVNLGAITASPRDVVRVQDGSASILIDGAADLGLPDGVKIDALHRLSDSQWVFSIDVAAQLNGTVYRDSDLIVYDGTVSLLVDTATLGLDDAADVVGISQGLGERWLIALGSGGQTSQGLVYRVCDVLIGNAQDQLASARPEAERLFGECVGLKSMDAVPAADGIFSDRFQN
jgi:hypothetical protein